MEQQRNAGRSSIEEGIQLLELVDRAAATFRSQESAEKRELLRHVLSNSSWIGGQLTATFRPPFNLILDEGTKARAKPEPDLSPTGGGGNFDNWRRGRDSNPRGVAPYGISSAAPSTGLGDLSFSWATS